MTLVEQINRTRELAGMKPLSEAQVVALQEVTADHTLKEDLADDDRKGDDDLVKSILDDMGELVEKVKAA